MIKEMMKQIRTELKSAEQYICCAKEYDDFCKIKNMYAVLASNKIADAKNICEHIDDRIKSMPQDIDNGRMEFLWEYESDMLNEDIASIAIEISKLHK